VAPAHDERSTGAARLHATKGDDRIGLAESSGPNKHRLRSQPLEGRRRLAGVFDRLADASLRGEPLCEVELNSGGPVWISQVPEHLLRGQEALLNPFVTAPCSCAEGPGAADLSAQERRDLSRRPTRKEFHKPVGFVEVGDGHCRVDGARKR